MKQNPILEIIIYDRYSFNTASKVSEILIKAECKFNFFIDNDNFIHFRLGYKIEKETEILLNESLWAVRYEYIR